MRTSDEPVAHAGDDVVRAVPGGGDGADDDDAARPRQACARRRCRRCAPSGRRGSRAARRARSARVSRFIDRIDGHVLDDEHAAVADARAAGRRWRPCVRSRFAVPDSSAPSERDRAGDDGAGAARAPARSRSWRCPTRRRPAARAGRRSAVSAAAVASTASSASRSYSSPSQRRNTRWTSFRPRAGGGGVVCANGRDAGAASSMTRAGRVGGVPRPAGNAATRGPPRPRARWP